MPSREPSSTATSSIFIGTLRTRAMESATVSASLYTGMITDTRAFVARSSAISRRVLGSQSGELIVDSDCGPRLCASTWRSRSRAFLQDVANRWIRSSRKAVLTRPYVRPVPHG